MKRVKHYTWGEAKKEIGDSKDYKLAKKVSIKKWQEILKYGQRYYRTMEDCGFCFVTSNKKGSCHFDCPTKFICRLVSHVDLKREDIVARIGIRRILKGLEGKLEIK